LYIHLSSGARSAPTGLAITEVELRKMLGLARVELGGFLKAHGINQEYSPADFEQERRALKELGL